MLDMEFVLFSSSPSQWSKYNCRVFNSGKKPYLTYNIKVESSRLNTPKLSEYQVSLYQKICELRFDENLTWKEIADSLNGLGYTSTRGGQNTSSTVCSTYFIFNLLTTASQISEHQQGVYMMHPLLSKHHLAAIY